MTEQSSYVRKDCRLCLGKELKLVIPIGKSAVGGAFVKEDKLSIKQDTYSLDLYQCKACGHVQLTEVVSPEILWSDYTYFSGRTSLIKHFKEYASMVMQESKLKEDSFVVDIGSNDGAFLSFFKERNMKVLGIDPAENVAEFANKSGVETLPRLFNMETAKYISSEYSTADIVTANNVFAHNDDMIGMASSVRELLKPDGLFYFEVSYLLDVIDKMLLGTIIHEHLCYHSVKPLESFLKKQGLELIDVKRVPIQGGSLICTAQRVGGACAVLPSVHEMIALENARGLYQEEFFNSFNSKLNEVKNDIATLIKNLGGKKLAAYGAARGGILLIYLFNLGDQIEYIVDDDPEKQNTYSPGHHIRVIPTSEIYTRKPNYTVILAWVHSKSIIEKNREYLEQGGKFITFFPKVEVVEK